MLGKMWGNGHCESRELDIAANFFEDSVALGIKI